MDYIKEYCDRLIKKHKTRDPALLAELIGVNLWYRNLGGLKGFYIYERKSRYIVINENLDEKTAKVVIAHELGHDCLHRTLARAGMRENTMFLENNKTERQANTFAAELLIDDRELIDAVYDYNDINALVHEIGLPPELIFIKLECLNKRGHNFKIGEFKNNFLARKK